MRSLRPCSDSSATPSFPSQPEGKIGLPRANPRGRLMLDALWAPAPRLRPRDGRDCLRRGPGSHAGAMQSPPARPALPGDTLVLLAPKGGRCSPGWVGTAQAPEPARHEVNLGRAVSVLILRLLPLSLNVQLPLLAPSEPLSHDSSISRAGARLMFGRKYPTRGLKRVRAATGK